MPRPGKKQGLSTAELNALISELGPHEPQSIDTTAQYHVSWPHGHRNGLEVRPREETEWQQSPGPCLVYATVNGETYLDVEKSVAQSPGFPPEAILAESEKAHGKVPILSGLEKMIMYEKRRAAGENWEKEATRF